MASSYTIKHSPEFSQLVAALSEQAQTELADVYRALSRGPLPGQSLLAVEPYSAVPNTYTVPFRGGVVDLWYRRASGSSAWWTWLGSRSNRGGQSSGSALPPL